MTPARDGTTAPVLRLRSAAFGYGERVVVSSVDLDVRAADTVGVLGANGSGKTTLVRGILGLNDHLGGDVELFGTPLARFSRRHLLGYVPQRHTLSASIAVTVGEIVAVGRLPHQGLLARRRREDRRIIEESLDLVGLEGYARRDVATLSGGQQRRVLIARALAAQPEVLIMDEPTAGIDPDNQHTLVAVLDRLVRKGVTLLVVTHQVEALRPVLHRGLVLSEGRIQFDGRVADLDSGLHVHDGHHDPLPDPGADPVGLRDPVLPGLGHLSGQRGRHG